LPNYYEILGVSKQATPAEVRQAYAKLAREGHPDRFSDPVQKEKAQQAFKDVTSAFNTLSSERERREYDLSLEKPQAQTPEERAREAFALGQSAEKVQNFAEAADKYRAAAHHDPKEAKYLAALGQVLTRSAHTSREAVDAFEKAIQLDPRAASYYVALGELLLREGLRLRARKVVEAGRRAAPRDPQILALSEELSRDSPDGGGPVRRRT
jgi:curved DNA-binding protein CbpA